MFTITVHYSKDRIDLLKTQVKHLSQINCEKILCVDGTTNIKPKDYKILEIERPSILYSRPKIWIESIQKAKNENILYLDCDRIVPIEFIQKALEINCRNKIIFPDRINNLQRISDIKNPDISMNKNPLSGCVMFHKDILEKAVPDLQFQGWRFADLDFYFSMLKSKIKPVSLDFEDVHLRHKYDIPKEIIELMYLWNGKKFFDKWNLPYSKRYNFLSRKWIKYKDEDLGKIIKTFLANH